jgi:hypothetical protein
MPRYHRSRRPDHGELDSMARERESEPRISEHRLADYAGYRSRFDVETVCRQCNAFVAPFTSHGHLR